MIGFNHPISIAYESGTRRAAQIKVANSDSHSAAYAGIMRGASWAGHPERFIEGERFDREHACGKWT